MLGQIYVWVQLLFRLNQRINKGEEEIIGIHYTMGGSDSFIYPIGLYWSTDDVRYTDMFVNWTDEINI